ncbi:HK97 family phage prohead protease [Qingshengfaniella alkalisoli]|uniref:HK97 family phage prohead protease n=1 Tax=Qingshengfaniella alkalisoli TaxID=2599296 RepID=A0A5B8I821_9RHOB|nr:HK97 family phage prohead protease [Qingshengfaniella alkalisoli]QDY69809.1 HK97 family phage prohead protease [Qingshengfaniella alkalisoli]
MLWGGSQGGLEIRTTAGGETRLTGRFPYRSPTELRQGRREVFESRAFGSRVSSGEDVHLLVGHDYEKPLASRSAGSLTLSDDDEALSFEARISPEMRAVGFVRDFLGTLAAGLVGGISPGFVVPQGGDEVRHEGGGVLRTVRQANLFEISVVTKPAYPQAQVEARNWTPEPDSRRPPRLHGRNRWRL